MSNFLARNRLIILAYAGMMLLLLVTALFSPGFLSAPTCAPPSCSQPLSGSSLSARRL